MADGAQSSTDSEGEGWLNGVSPDALEDDEDTEARRAEASAYASRARFQLEALASRLVIWDSKDAKTGTISTPLGPVHFACGSTQQERPWGCSLVLANFLVRNPSEACDRTVVELGCGVGLPGASAAVLGAKSVVLTDFALMGAESTVALNPAVAQRISVQQLRWGTADAVRLPQLPVDTVLCSDLLYGDEAAARSLAATLADICAFGTRVLSCHERRWAGDRGAAFFDRLGELGFAWEQLDTTAAGDGLGGDDDKIPRCDSIVVTRIWRKPNSGIGGGSGGGGGGGGGDGGNALR
ncbi:unnamed protein product [Phaeothamnion confervicola]